MEPLEVLVSRAVQMALMVVAAVERARERPLVNLASQVESFMLVVALELV